MMGLHNMIFLGKNDNGLIQDIIEYLDIILIRLDHNSPTGYPFAITSINISMYFRTILNLG